MGTSSRVINTIYIISFVDLLAVGLTFPVLAPYIRSLGVSHFKVGILSSAYSALQVLSGPIVGSWSDVRGRKPVFIITLALSSLCYLILGFCTSVYGIFIVRILLGIFKQTQTLNKALTADYVSGDDNTKIFGRSMAFSALGFVIGPFISGHLADMKNGFMYVCALTSILFLVNIGLVLILPDPKKKPNRKQRPNETFTLWKTTGDELRKTFMELKRIDWREHWVSFALKFLFVLSTTIFFVNQSLLLKEKYNLPQKHIGYAISFISFIGVVTSFFSNVLTKTVYGKSNDALKRAQHCFALLTVCFMVFFSSPNFYVIFLFLLPFGVCNALLRIVTMELTFSKCKEGDRGTLMGASDSVMSMGRFLAPMSAGLIGDVFGENAVMFYSMIVALIGVFICLFVNRKYKLDKVKTK